MNEPCETFPGPDWLGRGLVIRPESPLPAEFEACPRVRVDRRTLERAEPALAVLHPCWLERRRVVVELALPAEQLKQRERRHAEAYELEPAFELARERLHFLTWANNYDATREGPPVWWHGEVARRLGARPAASKDVELPGHGPLWCDGGPRGDLAEPVLHRESLESRVLQVTLPASRTAGGDLPELAEDQLQAVLHPAGAARIVAPAGSGKTRVLTERLRHLLGGRAYAPDRVTALAYNRRAAEEMRERTRDFEPHVRTLHSLGFEILRLARDPRLIEEREVRSLLRSLHPLPPTLGQDPWAPYLEGLAEIRLGLRAPAQVEARRRDVEGLAQLFPRYREALRKRNLVDHDEQIYGAIETLLADPELRRRFQLRCTHLLVDEFQDMTPAFLLLVRLLAAPAYQVFGVGDDDQVIYGYAGATPDYLIDFGDYFPGARHYALEVNYRCPQGVTRSAVRLLEKNCRRVAKVIRSGPAAPEGEPTVVEVGPAQAGGTALELLRTWLERHPPEQVAVLARVQAALLPIQVLLARTELPYRPLLDESVLERTGLKTALAYLRLAHRPREWRRQDLIEALRRPSRMLKRELVEQAADCGDADALDRLAERQEDWPAGQLRSFLEDLAGLAARPNTASALTALRSQIGLGQAMQELDGKGAEAATASHLDDLLALEELAPLHPEAISFEEWLREGLARRGSSGIRLSTVHRVKGMEWDCVLVQGLRRGLWPHRLAEDVEEERRIFHVALTRARREVAVLVDRAQPSPLVREIVTPRGTRSAQGLKALARSLGVEPAGLSQALEQLEEPERRVFSLRNGLVDGRRHTWKSMAGQLGVSVGMVKTWDQLARRGLRSRLGVEVGRPEPP